MVLCLVMCCCVVEEVVEFVCRWDGISIRLGVNLQNFPESFWKFMMHIRKVLKNQHLNMKNESLLSLLNALPWLYLRRPYSVPPESKVVTVSLSFEQSEQFGHIDFYIAKSLQSIHSRPVYLKEIHRVEVGSRGNDWGSERWHKLNGKVQ